jgi:hypothetical protein
MHLVTMIVPGEPGEFEIRMRLFVHGSARLAVEYSEHARALLREGLNVSPEMTREKLDEFFAENRRLLAEKMFSEGKVPLDAVPLPPDNPSNPGGGLTCSAT